MISGTEHVTIESTTRDEEDDWVIVKLLDSDLPPDSPPAAEWECNHDDLAELRDAARDYLLGIAGLQRHAVLACEVNVGDVIQNVGTVIFKRKRIGESVEVYYEFLIMGGGVFVLPEVREVTVHRPIQ